MIKKQNQTTNSEENSQEEKKVVRRGRPKKSENTDQVEKPSSSVSTTSESTAPEIKKRKARTSTTISNEVKPLENLKSKKKSSVTAIENSEEIAPKKAKEVETSKNIAKKTQAKSNNQSADTIQNEVAIDKTTPKRRGRKPKEIVNLAKDLDLSQEVREMENALAQTKNTKTAKKSPSSHNIKPENSINAPYSNDGIQNYNAQFIASHDKVQASSHESSSQNFSQPHENIQLLPSQVESNTQNQDFHKAKNHITFTNKSNSSEESERNEQSQKENRPNKGLSKNFFKRVPLSDDAINQKETMHNPMLYAAPKQLQGKQQPKKNNNTPQAFSGEQEPFYQQPVPHFNMPDSQENQYTAWQNNRQKPQNKNNQNRQKNNQMRQNQRQHSNVKNMPQPAFDNSSIIAAITGKNFDTDDMYMPAINNGYPANAYIQQNQHQAPPSFKNPQARQQKGQSKGTQKNMRKNGHMNGNFNPVEPSLHADENSLLHQNLMYQRSQASLQAPETPKKNIQNIDESNLKKLPFFAQTALEHKDSLNIITQESVETPYYTFEQAQEIQEEVVEKKTRGRKKKVENVVEEESNKNLKMFVSVQSEEQVEVALVKDDTVVEYFVELSHQAKIRGNIYKASIHNVDPNLQAAFINFGSVKNGFLQIDEVHSDYYLVPHAPSKNHKFPLISKVLRPGQELFVQIVKEPTLTKGAFLTTWISLAGRYLVLTPGQEQLGVSRKVSDPDERARLRSMLDGINPDKGMGIIIRTAAANATQEELQADLDYLQKLWLDILEKSHDKAAPALIHQEVELTQRVVRDYLNEDVVEIWTNDKEMAHSITKMAELLYPQKSNIVRHFNNHRASLWDRFNLQKQIDEISQREIALPSGGRVVFDQTEALMAIDINSGKTQNKSNFHDMVLQTNIEAAQAIARHLRLRDIGGQVVIDFIEVHDKNAVKEIEKAFKNAMRHDRARYEIGHISPFGLLEVIRQRIGSSAISISTEPCPHCHGTGTRRNMEWQAQDALKEIAKKARQEKTIKYIYTTNTELALYLLNMKRDRISELEERFNVRIEIQAG